MNQIFENKINLENFQNVGCDRRIQYTWLVYYLSDKSSTMISKPEMVLYLNFNTVRRSKLIQLAGWRSLQNRTS